MAKNKDIQVNTLQQKLMKLLAYSALALTALTLGGCASTGKVAAQQQQAPNNDYLIGPGDSLSIVVWRNPEVSQNIPVRPDGKITTPLVEDLQAAGKTPTELARDIEKALAKFIQQPVVTVIVTSFVGNFSEQVRVIGQAARPQALPFRRDMSLMDVLIAVGGVTEFAAGNRATIIRTINGQQQTLKVRLNDLIKDGDISANTYMYPGDILIIPESYF